LIAERPMYFDREAFNGGHDNVGQPDPSTTFYFAEGTTRRGFQEWLTVQNPGGQTAHVELSFMMDGGDNREMELTLAPHSRSTVKVIDIVGADRDVAVALRSDAPVVAERPMYFLYHDKWSGGHVSSGLDSPGNRFYFAEGTTREGFEEWICLMNPGEADATVQVTYMMEDGSTTSDSVLVEARSRETVDVAARVGPGRDVSALVESDVPVVAERPMYFSYGEGMWDGGHNCPGVEQAKTSFYFAEGTTREGFDEWITVMNPGEEAATVRITYMFGEGQGQALTREMAVGPHARATVDVAAETGRGKDVSVKLESSAPVLAERPMYFDYHGEAVGGDCSIGYGI
ncbi:MAG: hypothetical protein KJ625_03775, partial [Actinobacteria bacterium]|nr:hypothetical protein [Actinomycetota bacterium]